MDYFHLLIKSFLPINQMLLFLFTIKLFKNEIMMIMKTILKLVIFMIKVLVIIIITAVININHTIHNL